MFTAFVTTIIHVPGTVRFVYGPNLYGHGDRMRVEHRSVAFDPDSPQRAFLLLPKLREGRPKPTLAGSQRSQGPRRIGRPSVQSGIFGPICLLCASVARDFTGCDSRGAMAFFDLAKAVLMGASVVSCLR